MTVDHEINLHIPDDAKQMFAQYNAQQTRRQNYIEKASQENDNELCFRICTNSGTRINIPSEILKSSLIAGTILFACKVTGEIIGEVLRRN